MGRAGHWATALDAGGRKVLDRALPSSEDRLREVHEHLGEHGRVLVAVDRSATIGALAVAVAQAVGITVGCLPGLPRAPCRGPGPGQRQDRRS